MTKKILKGIIRIFISVTAAYIISRVTMYALFNYVPWDCFIETDDGKCLNFVNWLPRPIPGILELILFISLIVGIYNGLKEKFN